jgi:hypothetical protein
MAQRTPNPTIAIDVGELRGSTASDVPLLSDDCYVKFVKQVMTSQARLPDKDDLRKIRLYDNGLQRGTVFLPSGTEMCRKPEVHFG